MISVPYRGSIFPNCKKERYTHMPRQISVPYRGSIFPNITPTVVSKKAMMKFPSPIGVLFFQISRSWDNVCTCEEFPSPIGVLFFQIYPKLQKHILLIISVPYRGSIFPNKTAMYMRKQVNQISVPYRGSIFPNNIKNTSQLLINFRPLSGFYFSK